MIGKNFWRSKLLKSVKINDRYRVQVHKDFALPAGVVLYLEKYKSIVHGWVEVDYMGIWIHKIWNPFGNWDRTGGKMMLKDTDNYGHSHESWDVDSDFNLEERCKEFYSDYVRKNNLERIANNKLLSQ